MAKGISIITIVCLCLMFGVAIKSYAGPPTNPKDLKEIMNKHIEEMKLKNPKKYQEMIQRAGGNITACVDCHVEVSNENLRPKGSSSPLRK